MAKNKDITTTLSNTEKEILCIAVQNYPVIYDKKHANHYSRNIKINVWNRIAESFLQDGEPKHTPETLRATWKNLVDTRRTYIKREKEKKASGSAALPLQRWYLSEQTSFLDRFIDDASTTTNLKTGEASDNDDGETTMGDNDSIEDFEDEASLIDNDFSTSTPKGKPKRKRIDKSENARPVTEKRQKPSAFDHELLRILKGDEDKIEPDRPFFESLFNDFQTLKNENLLDETKEQLLKVMMDAKKKDRALREQSLNPPTGAAPRAAPTPIFNPAFTQYPPITRVQMPTFNQIDRPIYHQM